MYGRLLWLILLQGYTARPNRVGTRPVYVNERVSSRFWCDSCCMTKHDQISSGVSHRPITEGTGESSSRNDVFFFFFECLIFKYFNFFQFLKFLNFCYVRRKEGGVMPIYGKWVCLWPYMVPPAFLGFFGGLKCPLPYYYSRRRIHLR